jgi:hypothetical protein
MESMATIRMINYGQLIKAGINNERALQLQKISRSLHRLDEISCNCGKTPQQEKREENLEKQAQSIAKEHGFIAYHQSDPRGWSLYLVKPEQIGTYSIEAVYDRGIAVCSH